MALNFSKMAYWIKLFISPGRSLGIPTKDLHLFQICASVACDLLWFYRNKAHHDRITHNALAISRNINKVTLEYHAALKAKLFISVEKWAPSSEGTFKINYATAIRDSFSAQAAVCQNSKGKIMHMVYLISPPRQPNYGEAIASLLATRLAASLQLDRFILEGDSMVVALALHSNIIQD